MKGKLSTKTIVIGIITIVLLAVATTGTVLFLKDSGEAAAIDEQNTILPVSGNDNSSNVEQSGENSVENSITDSENQGTVNDENIVEATNISLTQNTRVLTEEPEVSVVEREKVISEETTLGWNKKGLNNNIGEINIIYKNLKYKIEYYFDGIKDNTLTEIFKGNEKGKVIYEYTAKDRIGYSLEKVEKLPLIILESNENNVIKVFYKINEYTAKFILNNGKADIEKTQEYGTEIEAPEEPEKEGYTFKGWDKEIPETMPAEDTIYTAQWEINSYNYKIEYYYENVQGTVTLNNYKFVKNEDKTEAGDTVIELKANYNTEITEYPIEGKQLSGYNLYKVIYGNNELNTSLKISATESNNIIKIYYIKKADISYTVNYYLENTRTKLADSKVVENQVFGSEVTEKAKDLKNIGYTELKSTETLVLNNIDRNELNFYYTPRNDLSYIVKYFFNGKVNEEKSYTETATFREKITNVTDYSNVGEWTLDENNSTVLPLEIKLTENVINIYYVKSDISAKKTANVIGKISNTTATSGDTIKYSILISNDGGIGDYVNITDSIPANTKYIENSITNSGIYNSANNSIEWNNIFVEAYSKIEVAFNVKVDDDIKIGSTISNIATVKDKDNNKIIDEPKSNDVTVDKTLKVTIENKKSVDKTNIVLILDLSESMNDKIKGTKKIDSMKSAVNTFISNVYKVDCDDSAKMSIVVFSGKAFRDPYTRILTYNNGKTIVKNKTEANEMISEVNGLSVEGSATWLGSGVHYGYEAINTLNNTYPGNRNIVILMSDGAPTGDYSYDYNDEANKIKKIATLYTIAFDIGDSATLKSISNGTGYYYTADNGNELINNYSAILNSVGTAMSTSKTSNESGKVIVSLDGSTIKYPIKMKVNGVETSYASSTELPNELTITSENIIWDISKYTVGTDLELIYQVNH